MIEMPTRNAKARIMRCVLEEPSSSPRIMKNNALAKAANTPRKNTAIKIVMRAIIQ